MGDLFDQDEKEPEGGAERRLSGEVPVGSVTFKGDELERVRRAVEYLGKLWPEISASMADAWIPSFTGGFTDNDFRRGCEAAREARALGFKAPTVSEFRMWCMGVTYPKRRASPETAREALRDMRRELRKGRGRN